MKAEKRVCILDLRQEIKLVCTSTLRKEEETSREDSGESSGGHLKRILVCILGASEAFKDRRSDTIKYTFLLWTSSFLDSFVCPEKGDRLADIKAFYFTWVYLSKCVATPCSESEIFCLIHGLAWFSLW